MQRWEFILYLSTLLCSSIAQETGSESNWNYTNQPRWEGECNTGNMQSPINLDRQSANTDWNLFPISTFDKIEFLNYEQRGNGNFSNTGHTVQMDVEYNDPNATPRVLVHSEDTSTYYFWKQMHFHWRSEHTINGQRYPLESHLVHISNDSRILVLGYMFEVCKKASSGMQVVGAYVKRLAKAGSTAPVSQFAPQRVMPSSLDLCGYFQYEGSLTTPPCTEGVTWLVRQEPLCVEQWELDAFNNVTNADRTLMAGNARDLQDLNGRTVTYHQCVFPSLGWWFW